MATYGDPEADAVDEMTPFSWQTVPLALALYAASKINRREPLASV